MLTLVIKVAHLRNFQITKAAVTNFQPGRRIPHCAFELQLLPGKTFHRLLHKVELKVIGTSFACYFHIRYPQPEGQLVILYHDQFLPKNSFIQ